MKPLKLNSFAGKALFLIGLSFSISIFSTNAQQWKEEAWARIDSFRKNDLKINVLSAGGNPLKDATVKVKLKKHSFIWGAVLRSAVYNSSPYKVKYKTLYRDYFNSGEFEIGMKPAQRGNYWEKQADQAVHLFYQNNIDLRGHTLVWEGPDFLPDDAKKVYNNNDLTNQEKGDSLLKILDDHLYHAIPKWNVKWWDVINEPVVNNVVNKLLPDYNTFVHWFKLADSLRTVYDKDFKLVLNENQVISGNAKWAESRIPDFQKIIDEMLAEGAPIEMLGFQGRIQYGMLSPEKQYQRLLMFDKYNLPYQATEFEIRDSKFYNYSESQVKQLTEETMTVFFSHRKVEGFWHWTFVDDKNGTQPWALFNYDGTPRPTGEKWIDLMEGKFTTDSVKSTDDSGNCTIRGFRGEYDVEISYRGESITKSLTLTNDTLAIINTNFIPTSANYFEDKTFCISQNTRLNSFSIHGNFEIEQVKLYDLSGRIIRQYVNDNIYKLDGIKNGLYLVFIKTQNKVYSRKIWVR